MLIANACLHKENINSVQPYWEIKQKSESSLVDLCLFVSCVRQAHSRTADNKPEQLEQAMGFMAAYKRRR